MSDYLSLIIEFFKTGLFALGGGLATVPFLHDMTTRFNWFTEEELANMIAVAESTPGPIGINMATFAGFKAGGVAGALLSTLFLVLPSFIIIILISRFMGKFKGNIKAKAMLKSVRPAVCALIFSAGYSLLTASLSLNEGIEGINIPAAILFVIAYVIVGVYKKVHPVAIIALGAIAGIVLKL